MHWKLARRNDSGGNRRPRNLPSDAAMSTTCLCYFLESSTSRSQCFEDVKIIEKSHCGGRASSKLAPSRGAIRTNQGRDVARYRWTSAESPVSGAWGQSCTKTGLLLTCMPRPPTTSPNRTHIYIYMHSDPLIAAHSVSLVSISCVRCAVCTPY
jgi:hypothetical protein